VRTGWSHLKVLLAFAVIASRASGVCASPVAIPDVIRSPLLLRANVFSDNSQVPHDPRHIQPQSGAGKMFAPIGLIATSHKVPHQYGPRSIPAFDEETAFLVSPCYVLTAYHGVFGNAHAEPEPNRDYSMTFETVGWKSRAVPVRYGAWENSNGGDWALLRLDACLGENPDIGWAQLAPLNSTVLAQKRLSTAGYPADRSGRALWRQDICHFYHQERGADSKGIWTTDCPTQPRASGSPIFFIQNGVLNVVGIMHGHLGPEHPNEVLPQFLPNRANLAVDVSEIVASDPEVLTLIRSDIARFGRRNPAQIVLPRPQK
jgi:V8-like Glu-specific endopeptidase